MMRARIVRGRIRVTFDGFDEDEIFARQERIAGLIGSANRVDGSDDISCALSATNFRKLREFGCKLADDSHTLEVVAKLRREMDAYNEESKRAREAKDGRLFVGYEFKKKPFKHQLQGFQFLHALPTAALFGDCGTGKTFQVLTFADSLVKAGHKIVFIVVCPVNLICHVWQDDAKKFSDLTFVGLREPKVPHVVAADYDEPGDPNDRKARSKVRAERRADSAWRKKAKRRAQARHRKLIEDRFAQDVDLYIINPENLRTDAKEKRILNLCKRKKKEGFEICLVIDESSRVKSRVSRTYKSLKRIRHYCENRCIIMTGTPSPNGILDLWAQFSLLDDGKTLQPSFTDYRADTCTEQILKYVTWEDKQGNKHNAKKWATKPGAGKRVYRMIEPRMIRFRTEDCIDLPPHRFIIRDVEMTAEQSEVYTDMEERLFAELEGEPITAPIAATRLIKLREVTGGFIRTDEGKDIQIGKNSPKMIELDTLLEQSIADKLGDGDFPSKALVWANYRWECTTLVNRYRRYGARGLFGGISSSAKDFAISQFKSNPNCRLLICHPASVGHGLTLTEANHAFYYSLSYNFEEFYQSFRRMTRPGQTRPMTYWFLVCPNTIDEELIDALRSKKNLSDIITDGRFSKEDFIDKRGKNREFQMDLGWEVPGD